MGRGPDIIVLDELLLLSNHILQIDDRAGLQLQVQQKLHVLRLQEVVLDDELEEVSIVLHLDSLRVADRVANVSNLGVILVKILLH